MLFWLIGIANLALLSVGIYYWKGAIKSRPLATVFLPSLALKCFAGLLLGAVYRYHYGHGDMFSYFSDAGILSDFFFEDFPGFTKALFFGKVPEPWSQHLYYHHHPRAFLMSRILSIFSILTASNFWLMGIYCSLIGFAGMWALANRLAFLFPDARWVAAVSFLFFPSVVFWSSGISKESIVMGCMCYSLSVFLPYYSGRHRPRWFSVIVALLLLVPLWYIKYYYAGVLLAVLFSGGIVIAMEQVVLKRGIPLVWRLPLWTCLFAGLLLTVSQSRNNLRMENIGQVIIKNHRIFIEKSDKEDIASYTAFDASPESWALNIPRALFNGLFAPALWNLSQWDLKLPLALENLVLLLLGIRALPKAPKCIKSPYWTLFCMGIGYILLLAILLALSTPNYGTLVRYRIGYAPFFIYLVLLGNLRLPVSVRKICKKLRSR